MVRLSAAALELDRAPPLTSILTVWTTYLLSKMVKDKKMDVLSRDYTINLHKRLHGM